MNYPLICLVGPSGSGKTTMVKALLEAVPSLSELVSTTTREPRVGESEANPYYFVSREEFQQLLATDAFTQTVSFGGNEYGTTKFEVHSKLAKGPAIVIVEAEGPAKFRRVLRSPVVTVFLEPPAPSDLVDRMRSRRDSEAFIAQRTLADESIWQYRSQADYVVVSTTIPETLSCLMSILQPRLAA